MKIIILFLGIVSISFSNSATFVDDGMRSITCGSKAAKIDDLNLISKAGRLSKVTQKSLTLSKTDNIQNLVLLGLKENKIKFKNQCKYIESFKNIYNGDKLLLKCLNNPTCDIENFSSLMSKSSLHVKIASKYPNMTLGQIDIKVGTIKNIHNGDKLLLKCLKNRTCDIENFSSLMSKSSLHVKLASKYPNMTLGQINIKVGTINENIMNKYFQSTGWTKIEGEVGRNGIDGLFIKKKNGIIADVLVVESKYNKSGLQHTKSGQQMTKQWVNKKVDNLIKQYPDNSDYVSIKQYIDNDIYRAMLWNMKTTDDSLLISLKHIHDKAGKVATSEVTGNAKMKINFNGNQDISVKTQRMIFIEKLFPGMKMKLNRRKINV